ncbi:hypothetical protein OC25_26515 [Pedobacter kyungheensis]|uniref:Alpha-L-fucosidase C-terminal domain-containing protein n=1 Tax=Pedobacter kyungheensis TaxID=1069985 RepID=A0A0C1CUQ7_9SPHI|nr:hypothetical protein [Pedobacter kyungheensis]KIA88016.1 hypothetical protein OC25_26515 [Pedobacter kyungheensis]
MPLENTPQTLTHPLKNAVDIRVLEPIIFYSGKHDELQIHVKEALNGELIIKSLNTAMLEIKAVMLADTDTPLNWKQNKECLKITFDRDLMPLGENANRVIKVVF